MTSVSSHFSVIPKATFEKAKQSPNRPEGYPCHSRGEVLLWSCGFLGIRREGVIPATCGRMNRSQTRVALCPSCSTLTDPLLESLQNYRSRYANSNFAVIEMLANEQTQAESIPLTPTTNSTETNEPTQTQNTQLTPIDHDTSYHCAASHCAASHCAADASKCGSTSSLRFFGSSALFITAAGLVLYAMKESGYI